MTHRQRHRETDTLAVIGKAGQGRVVESDDRFFPRMIDHVSSLAPNSSQDCGACLIRPPPVPCQPTSSLVCLSCLLLRPAVSVRLSLYLSCCLLLLCLFVCMWYVIALDDDIFYEISLSSDLCEDILTLYL